MARPAPYSYSDAGFNGFFRRTLVSSPNINNLRNLPRGQSNQLNFENVQVSGSMGDKLQVGRIILNGQQGRIEVQDKEGNEMVRIGALYEE